MTNGWTDERRERQAEAIRKYKPWEKSTGPKSAKGKAASSRNAIKHGLYGEQAEAIKALLRMNADFLSLYAQLNGGGDLQSLLKQTDRKFNEINGKSPRSPRNGGTK